MADVDFRVKFPYQSSIITIPLAISTEEPIFTSINQLDITDNIPAGTYNLTITYQWSMPDVNDSAIFRVISPITVGTEFRQEPKSLDDVVIRTFIGEYTWGGGPILIDFQGSITVGGQTLTVDLSQVIFERKT